MPVALRPLQRADLEALETFEKAAAAPGEAGLESFTRRLGRRGFTVFGAFDGERLVGAVSSADAGTVQLLGRLQVAGKPWPAVAPGLLSAALEHTARPGQPCLTEVAVSSNPLMVVHFFQKLGFWPRHVFAHLARAVPPGERPLPEGWSVARAADAPSPQATFALLDQLHPGLRIPELAHGLADDELLLTAADPGGLGALALCRRAVEGPLASLTVRLGAVRPGAAPTTFDALLDACAALASRVEARRLRVTVNAVYGDCHTRLLARGFANVAQGFAFHRPDVPAHLRPGLFVLDDWR